MADNDIRRALVAASVGAPCPVVRLYGHGACSWHGAPVRVLDMADAGRSVWLARVEHDGDSWVFSGPSFAVLVSDIDTVNVVHDPCGRMPVAGGTVDMLRVGATVDVELADGDAYRARVLGIDATGTHVALRPTPDNGGGAAGTPEPDQLAPRWVALSDIACVFPVHDGLTVPSDPSPLDVFRSAFAAWRDATERMDAAWSDAGVPGDVFGDTYPAGLPSFDELAALVAGMVIAEPRPVPVAPRAPIVGERVVFTRSPDRESLGAFIAAGTTGTVTYVDDDVITVRPDDDAARAALTEWDGCVTFTPDDGYDTALDVFGRDADALTDTWSPLDVAAFGAWRVIAPVSA